MRVPHALLAAAFAASTPGLVQQPAAQAVQAPADVSRLDRVNFVTRRGVVHKLAGQRQVFPAQ